MRVCIQVVKVLPGIILHGLLPKLAEILSTDFTSSKLNRLTDLSIRLLLNPFNVDVMAISELRVYIYMNWWTLCHLRWNTLIITVISISCRSCNSRSRFHLRVFGLRCWLQYTIRVCWDNRRIVDWRSVNIRLRLWQSRLSSHNSWFSRRLNSFNLFQTFCHLLILCNRLRASLRSFQIYLISFDFCGYL